MTVELKHVVIDDVGGRSIKELREIASDCDVLKGAVQAEIKRQLDEAQEALAATGGSDLVKPAAAKRGPKPKTAKESEVDVVLDDVQSAQISGRA